jgi:heme/copper-type cytochrome/quinol oxidase subunit 3
MSEGEESDLEQTGGTTKEVSPSNPKKNSKVRGILSLFMWNQVLIIASLFLAMMGLQTITAGQNSIPGMAVTGFLLLLAIGLLITSADFFVEGAKGLARRVGIAEIIIGLTIVSLGTSLPEILISTQAA